MMRNTWETGHTHTTEKRESDNHSYKLKTTGSIQQWEIFSQKDAQNLNRQLNITKDVKEKHESQSQCLTVIK